MPSGAGVSKRENTIAQTFHEFKRDKKASKRRVSTPCRPLLRTGLRFPRLDLADRNLSTRVVQLEKRKSARTAIERANEETHGIRRNETVRATRKFPLYVS